MTAPDPADQRSPDRPTPARSFGRVADSYERGRPDYPSAAVTWLLDDKPLSVLELGAGTGKLTSTLEELGHDVFATDPDDAMLDVLSGKLPDVRATAGTAEQIPAGDDTYDAVVVGQAFHWFDVDLALPEIVRVLRPGGRIAIIRNERDERIPWVRKLGRLIGYRDEDDPTRTLDMSALFSAVESREFRHWHDIDRESIQDLVLSRSGVAVLDEERREAKRREVLAFYDDYGRGMDGMRLPYICRAYRATVLPHVASTDDRPAPAATASDDTPADSPSSSTDTVQRLPRIMRSEEDDTDTILIDFD